MYDLSSQILSHSFKRDQQALFHSSNPPSQPIQSGTSPLRCIRMQSREGETCTLRGQKYWDCKLDCRSAVRISQFVHRGGFRRSAARNFKLVVFGAQFRKTPACPDGLAVKRARWLKLSVTRMVGWLVELGFMKRVDFIF